MTAIAYILQCLLAAGMVLLGLKIAGRGGSGGGSSRSRRAAVWACVLGLLVMGLFPLMRVFPTLAIRAFGAPAVACVEITGLLIPAALVFTVGAMRVPKPADRRAVLALLGVASAFFLWSGRWMVWHSLPNLGPTKMHMGVCKQSTDYTCVGASLVTLLHAHGVRTSEQEMCELAYVQVGGGSTDSRALWALQRKLAGTQLRASYDTLDYPGLVTLCAGGSPALVQLNWSFFMSHMVPVMSADAAGVIIGDPLTGPRRLPVDEFLRLWKRQAIVIARSHTHGTTSAVTE